MKGDSGRGTEGSYPLDTTVAKVLVIDDAASILEHIAGVLGEAGHEVTTANNARAGMQILAQRRIDVVITDIYMPELDGFHVIRHARKLQPDVAIIAMSGKTGEWNMLRVAEALGANLTIAKPFANQQLVDAVKRYCSE